MTPFKQTRFIPYGTDEWTEYWYPFAGTGGVTDANELGVLGIAGGTLKISALGFIKDTLLVQDSNGNLLYRQLVVLKPLEVISVNTGLATDLLQRATIRIKEYAWTAADSEIHRPLTTPADFDWNDAYGLYLYARDLAGLKNYPEAEEKVRQALGKNKNYVPALTLLSGLLYNRMEYDTAFAVAKQALSVDAYDGAANYYYALAALRTGHTADALDGFHVAVLITAFRSAAYTGISRIFFVQGAFAKARHYAESALVNNQNNLEALQLQYLINRIEGKDNGVTGKRIAAAEPLSHFLLFEKYFQAQQSPAAFKSSIQNEFPYQTCLELAIWYDQLGRAEEAEKLLLLSPPHQEIFYWLAYINRNRAAGMHYLQKALDGDPDFVFPFRQESGEVFSWALTKTKNWKPVYLQALLNLSLNNKEKARHLINGIHETISFAPFYIVKASLAADTAEQCHDLIMADKAGNGSWRYKNYLIRYYLSVKAYKTALQVAEPFYKKHPKDYINGMLYIRALMRNNRYVTADEVLKQLNILPFEGAGEGRRLYEETKLMRALDALEAKDDAKARRYLGEAALWPRNMGVGKPYETLIDDRIEQLLNALLLLRAGNKKEAILKFEVIAGSDKTEDAPGALAQVAALVQLNRSPEAVTLFNKWASGKNDRSKTGWAATFLRKLPDPHQPDLEQYRQLVRKITETEDKRLF